MVVLLFAITGCHANQGDSTNVVVTRPVKRLDGTVLKPEQVAARVERLMAARKVTGLALAILNDGEVVYLQGFGWRDAKRKLPLTPTTTMYAASFTKAMFACMVMQLVEEGKLDLDRPVHEYLAKPLPDYPRHKDLARDGRWKLFTARMLLSHTSGLPNWRWINSDKKLDIKFAPGSKYSYSGEGISLLQLVVEQITKRDVADLMRERVFTKCGMTRTSMVWESAFEKNFALGCDEQEKPLGHRKWESPGAAGSADSDVAGMAAFLQCVLNGKGLGAKARQEMLSPQIRIRSMHQFPTPSNETTDRDDAIRLSYGLGWGLFWSPYGKAFFKEGHDDGWENYMVAFEDSKTAIVIMTNSSNGESIFPELLSELIADRYTPSAWERFGPPVAAQK